MPVKTMKPIKRFRMMEEDEVNKDRRYGMAEEDEMDRDKRLISYEPNLRAATNAREAQMELFDDKTLPPNAMLNQLQWLGHYIAALIKAHKGSTAEAATAPLAKLMAGLMPAPAAVPVAVPVAHVAATTPTITRTTTTTTRPHITAPDPTPLEQVLAPLSKRKHDAAKQAIQRLEDGGVTFDDDLRLVLGGKPVEGSNFADLMHAMYAPDAYRMPPHTQEFINAMRSIDFPARYIPNALLKASVVGAAPGSSTPKALAADENLNVPTSGTKRHKYAKGKAQQGFGLAALASLMNPKRKRPSMRTTKPLKRPSMRTTKPLKRVYHLYP